MIPTPFAFFGRIRQCRPKVGEFLPTQPKRARCLYNSTVLARRIAEPSSPPPCPLHPPQWVALVLVLILHLQFSTSPFSPPPSPFLSSVSPVQCTPLSAISIDPAGQVVSNLPAFRVDFIYKPLVPPLSPYSEQLQLDHSHISVVHTIGKKSRNCSVFPYLSACVFLFRLCNSSSPITYPLHFPYTFVPPISSSHHQDFIQSWVWS